MFAAWIKNTVVIFFGAALLGYLNGGTHGMGYAMGAALIVAPISGLIWTFINRG